MFKRFKKGKQSEPTANENKTRNNSKVSKKKRVRMKRRKANFPILSLLEIPKTVPITIQGELKVFSEEIDGAVRATKDGYTVIALTYDQLEKSGLKDADDDDFGQFSLGLRGDTMRSATRIEDLEQGNIIFIPNEDTIHALSEYDSLKKITFNWALYPDNPETIDETETTIKDKTLTIDEMLGILHSPDRMDDLISNGFDVEEDETNNRIPSVLVNNEENEEDSIIEETVVYDEDEVESTDNPETPFEVEDEPINDPVNEEVEELPVYTIPEPVEVVEEVVVDSVDEVGPFEVDEAVTELFEEEIIDNTVIDDDTEDETGMAGQEKEMREIIEPEDFKNELIELASRTIEDPDISFEVRADDFNVLFGARKPYHFKLTDSKLLLNTILNEKRQQYNSELARIHESNTQQLAQAYTSRMDSAVSKARALLDTDSEETQAGKERIEIEERFKEDNSQTELFLDKVNHEKREKYEKAREEYAESIKQRALADYDVQNKYTLERVMNESKAEITSANILARNTSLKELHVKRQKVANRLIDDTHREVIGNLQEVYTMMMEDEEAIRKEMEDELTDYMHNHFKDDTMRNEALAEKLRQETEASRVRKEMEERMNDNQKFIENMQAQADANIESIQREHRVFIEQMQTEYNREMQAKSKVISEREEALRQQELEAKDRYKEQREDNRTLLNEAKLNYENELIVLRESLDSQTRVIETFRSKKDKRLTSVILGSLGLITLLVLTFVFLFTQQYTETTKNMKPSEITLTTNSPLLNGETTANENSDATDDVIDAYVATSTDEKEPSVIIGYKDAYKNGDEVKIIGSMEGGAVTGSLKVKSVKDELVTLESNDGKEYTFVATK